MTYKTKPVEIKAWQYTGGSDQLETWRFKNGSKMNCLIIQTNYLVPDGLHRLTQDLFLILSIFPM